MHHGVGLIIRNQAKSLFFVQKKDETYPLAKWVGTLSTWGGKIEEEDGSPFKALLREVDEELAFPLDPAKITLVGEFLVQSDSDYAFSLYEIAVDEATLEALTQQSVNEGSSALLTREELLKKDWVWGLDEVIFRYFRLKGKEG